MRGLNNPSKHRMLKNLIQQENPSLVFLQETKSNNAALERILNKAWIGSRSVLVDASGASGGLAIAWNPKVLTLQDFHATHFFIQASFHLIGTNIHGFLTNVYFPQVLHKKLALLDTLTVINSNRQYPLWINDGDYNIITTLEEKKGGRMKLEGDSIGFKEFIQSNHLMDIQTSNDNAIHLGGDFHASIPPQGGSDHWPIMLQWSRPGKQYNRPFCFEAFWFTNPNFKDMVRAAWKSYTPPEGPKMFQFQQKLKNLKQVLKVWNKTQFGNILETRKKLEQHMCSLQQTIILEGRTEALAHKEQILWSEIEAQRLQEEILWRQKSRIRWLKEGEKNTKFFHRSTIQRRMHNNIAFINNRQGERL
eukprot:PITA_16325